MVSVADRQKDFIDDDDRRNGGKRSGDSREATTQIRAKIKNQCKVITPFFIVVFSCNFRCVFLMLFFEVARFVKRALG
jgi:hypothetical protein